MHCMVFVWFLYLMISISDINEGKTDECSKIKVPDTKKSKSAEGSERGTSDEVSRNRKTCLSGDWHDFKYRFSLERQSQDSGALRSNFS
jgi:hypothetical protein